VQLDRTQLVNIVQKLPLFAQLPEQAGVDLIQGGQLIEFKEEELLITQGQVSEYALALVDGVVEVFVESKYGSVNLATFEAPAFVGEIGVFTNVPRTASIKAKTKVRAVRIGVDELHRFGQQNPSFLSGLMLQLGHRFETFNKAIGFYSHALGALERDDFDLALLEDLRHPLPELVDFSRSFVGLAEQIVAKRALREEMANARAIQQSMLPDNELLEQCRDYVAVHAAMRPARDVGGDLYDYFLLDTNRLAVTVGDVCGKGIPAALFMAMTQMVMRYMLRQEGDVGSAATAGNALLSASNREMMFATLFCAVIDLRSGQISYCSCGHHSPLILRKGKPIETITVSSLPLGLNERAQYKTNSLLLDPGDQLFLFTDGFVDVFNSEEVHFGDERLHEVVERLRALPVDQLVPELIKSIDEFAGNQPQYDDLTALVVDVLARKPSSDQPPEPDSTPGPGTAVDASEQRQNHG
jgi:sigma-B regulation protein RsbU (phosphoserine phosphatase)